MTAAVRARVSARTSLVLAALASCESFAIWGIFSGWEWGTPDDYSTAVLLACLAGVAVSVLVGWTAARRTGQGPVA
ncbi:hypothetical protein [Streptosporangium sp. NPDC087985]|uniref:hypothetical protein n=1 Tax=Streptosporangium sp. NPDC087985 TaxID=3366196 RepID=UPI00381E6DC8